MVKYTDLIVHPSIIVILGHKRQGKTGLACGMLDHFHNQGLKTCVVGGKQVKKAFPNWVDVVNPKTFRFPNDSVSLIDDLHLYSTAKEWYSDPTKVLETCQKESGQKDITFIHTTHHSIVIEKNVLAMVDVVFFKKPSLLQKRLERKELKEIFEVVDDAFKQLPEDVDHRKYAYYLSQTQGEGMIEPHDLPEWFNPRISKIYKDTSIRVSRFNEILNM